MKGVVILAKVDEMYKNLKSGLAFRRKEIWSKWMHFQHVLTSWDLQQITGMLYLREIAEIPEHIVTDVYICMLQSQPIPLKERFS